MASSDSGMTDSEPRRSTNPRRLSSPRLESDPQIDRMSSEFPVPAASATDRSDQFRCTPHIRSIRSIRGSERRERDACDHARMKESRRWRKEIRHIEERPAHGAVGGRGVVHAIEVSVHEPRARGLGARHTVKREVAPDGHRPGDVDQFRRARKEPRPHVRETRRLAQSVLERSRPRAPPRSCPDRKGG